MEVDDNDFGGKISFLFVKNLCDITKEFRTARKRGWKGGKKRVDGKIGVYQARPVSGHLNFIGSFNKEEKGGGKISEKYLKG